MMTDTIQILLYFLCLIASGFFSGIETGVISIHPVRLLHCVKEKVRGATTLQGFADDSDRLLGTTLVGTNLCVVIVSVVSASYAARHCNPTGESLFSVGTAVMVLVFAEYLPKAWFHARPLARSLRYTRVLTLSELLPRPTAALVIGITRVFLPGKTTFGNPGLFATKEDLKQLADEGVAHGAISHTERSMITRVFELSGKKASEVMVPREDMTFVNSDQSLEDFFEVARSTSFTRMPVFDTENQEFVGIINVFFVLSQRERNSAHSVGSYARPSYSVFEDTPVDDILPLMRRNRQPLCLVRNTVNEVVGLLTIEDILEEIVGRIEE